MDRKEKEQVISEAIQRLVKNKGLDLKINRMWTDSGYFNVELDYSIVHNITQLHINLTIWFI